MSDFHFSRLPGGGGITAGDITGKPAATLPLAGTEELLLVQGGEARQVTAGDLGGGDWQKVVLASDFSVTSSTTVVEVTGLSTLQLDADSIYEVDGFLHHVTNGGGGKIRMNLPSSAIPAQTGVVVYQSPVISNLLFQPVFTTAQSEEVNVMGTTTSGRTCAFRGFVHIAGTGGPFQLFFAQQTSNVGASTIKAGSFIRVKKV